MFLATECWNNFTGGVVVLRGASSGWACMDVPRSGSRERGLNALRTRMG